MTTIHTHGELVPLADNLWQVTAGHGLPIQRNMVVYRLPHGGLVLHSVVAMHARGREALDALGRPEVMIVPHAKHSMDAASYKERYPTLKVVCPGQSRKEVEQRRGVPVDGEPDAFLAEHGIVSTPIPGSRYEEYLFELPVPGGVAFVFCDALANDGREIPGFVGRAFGAATGVPGGGLGVSRIMKTLMTVDKVALRGFLEGLAARDDVVLVSVAHGEAVVEDVSAALARAAARL